MLCLYYLILRGSVVLTSKTTHSVIYVSLILFFIYRAFYDGVSDTGCIVLSGRLVNNELERTLNDNTCGLRY